MSIDIGERIYRNPSDAGQIHSASHAVFLGTFNASTYREKIESWLPRLDLTGTCLVVSDNSSTDETVDWMLKLIQSLRVPSVLIRNQHNLGGYGNLMRSLPFLEGVSWVTTLHQDDSYSHDHVQLHVEQVAASTQDLGMICSEAASVEENGRKIPYPRAHWLLEGEPDPKTVFLAHLRNHSYPFSGATFRKRMLEDFSVPWHSTAFPDTELVMKACVRYKASFTKGVSVEYLENPISESHRLDSSQRDFGAYFALARVFGHQSFRTLCLSISEEEQPNFIRSLSEGISIRFQHESLRSQALQLAMEMTSEHFGPSQGLASELISGYSRVGDSGAVGILETFGATSREEHLPEGADDLVRKKPGVSRNMIRNGLLKIAGTVPKPARRLLFQLVMRTSIGKKKFKAFDFDWNK